ncbi:MAG: ATP-binding protein [Bacteroidota bacterium]
MKYLRRYLLSAFFTLLLFFFASGNEQDSIILDSALLKQVNEAIGLFKKNKDSSDLLLNKLVKKADNNEQYSISGKINYFMARSAAMSGNYQSALEKLLAAKKAYEAASDSSQVGLMIGQIGSVYNRLGRKDLALENLQNGIRISEKYMANSRFLSNQYNNLGLLLMDLNDLSAAEEIHQKALGIREELNDTSSMAISWMNIGLLQKKSGELDAAEKSYLKSLAYQESINNYRSIEFCRINLANLYNEQNKSELAEEYFQKALETNDITKNKFSRISTLEGMANLADRAADHQQAIKLRKEAVLLAREVGSLGQEKGLFNNLYNSYQQTGDYENALIALEQYVELKDSLENVESQKRVDELKTQFETEQKESEIEKLKLEEAKRTQERNLLIVGTAILAAFISMILYYIGQRKIAFNELQNEKQKSDQLLVDLKSAQQQLIQSEKMASLGQLTAGVAHEINNPVNFISAGVQALKFDFADLEEIFEKLIQLDEKNAETIAHELARLKSEVDLVFLKKEMTELVDSIENGAKRTSNIVVALKSFSHQSEGKLVPVDIHVGIESSLTILSHKLKEEINIEKNYGELPKVSCQPSRLNQVFLNLLDNAIHALDGAGKISIKTKMENGQAVISIRDTGKGMEEATQKRIFEPFFTTKKVGEGTGLGLAISYGIVKDHNGRFEVKSAVGEGTEFLVWLPL